MMRIISCCILLLCSTIYNHSQTFTKVTQGSFVNDGGASRTVNFIDYDNDGDLDLFVSNGKKFGQRNFAYNNAQGNFTRVLLPSLTSDSLPFDGGSWADFDNDGDLDVCVVAWYDSTNMLYQNNGGSFSLLGSSPVVTNRGFSETCSWGDYDNDGLIDLFVTNSEGFTAWKNFLYKNAGNGNFIRIDTGVISTDMSRFSRGINWVDIDGDGDVDIFICNDNNQNELMYKNEGHGYFTKVTGIAPVLNTGNTRSSSWGDYDNDGDFDLFTTNTGNQKNALFRNNGNFSFTKILNDTIVKEPGYFACSGWGDYDNDGDLDMFVTQAYKTPDAPLKNYLYKNLLRETGTPSFEKVSGEDVVNDAGYSYGFSWGDWDRDGDLDLFMAKTYNEAENNAAYVNNGNANSWIEIKCMGVTSNKSAIGAKVRIKATIGGNAVWQTREVDAQSGYCGENLDIHFGLGDAAIIDSLKIEWPAGNNGAFANVAVNQIITIAENQIVIGVTQYGDALPHQFSLLQNYPNPFNPVTNIRYQLPVNGFVTLKVYDVEGRAIATLANEEQQAGYKSVAFDAAKLSSGIYFYTLVAGSYEATRKMILMK